MLRGCCDRLALLPVRAPHGPVLRDAAAGPALPLPAALPPALRGGLPWRGGLVQLVPGPRVVRVLPGMQAAFIYIGLERTAFLHVSDIVQPADAEGSGDAVRTDNIRKLVSEGGDILVQFRPQLRVFRQTFRQYGFG